MTSLPESGLRIGDRYELTRRIAGGGMGEVWSAHDLVLDREVAVKLLRREYADDPGFVERFRAEARHAASLSHPGIASVYDYGELGGSEYLVMELVPGRPLSAIIAERGALTAAEAVPLIQQAALALHEAHVAGLVHRDVKPGNLLVTPDGHVKVTDFGIARAGGQAPLTRTGEVMGTAQYLAPEQAMGRPATASSDVYSLGIVAYEALSGHRPFDADNPVAVAMSQVNDTPPPLPPTVPPAVAAVVLQSLAKDPDERPHTAADLSDALGRAMRGQGPAAAAVTQAITAPVAAPVPAAAVATGSLPTGPLPTGYSTPVTSADDVLRDEPARRNVGLWVLIALLVTALIALAVLLLTNRSNGDSPTAPRTPTTTSTSNPPTTTDATSAPRTVPVNEADYLGLPADEVAADLRRLGLDVATKPVTTDEYEPGTVANVTPTGNLMPGDRVTLSVAQAPATTSAPPSTPSETPSLPSSEPTATASTTSDATQPAPTGTQTAGADAGLHTEAAG